MQNKKPELKSELREVHLFQLAPIAGVAVVFTITTTTNNINNTTTSTTNTTTNNNNNTTTPNNNNNSCRTDIIIFM